MENASKALLIAGAILICILLIAVGMYIFQSANATIESAASRMNDQDKQMYNSMIKQYIGDSRRGTDVKQMIESVINQNDQNVTESGKFISIKVVGSIPNYNTAANLSTVCDAANVYAATPGENTQEKINAAKAEMRNLSKYISSGKRYSVTDSNGAESGVKDGIIHTVYITEL